MEQTKSRSKSPAARILSLALALCMIAAFVPAFTLTAGAASAEDFTIDTLVSVATTVFDGSYATNAANGDTPVANIYDGWSMINSSYGANVRNYTDNGVTMNYLQTYEDSGNLNGYNTADYSMDGYDYMILEFGARSPEVEFGEYGFFDTDGTAITAVRVGYADSNAIAPIYTFGSAWKTLSLAGTPTSTSGVGLVASFVGKGKKARVLITNDEVANTHTVVWYTNVSGSYEQFYTETYEGTVNGLGQIQAYRIYNYTYSWSHMGLGDFMVYMGTYPASTATATIKYTVGGETVNELSQTYDASSADSYTFDKYYYSPGNGSNVLYYAAAKEVANDTTETVEMTKLDNWGNYDTETNNSVTVDGKVYTITGGNIVPNGDFSHGMNGWYSRANTTPPTNYSVTTTDVPDGVTQAAVSSGNGGSTYPNSLGTYWKIDSGATYYYSYWMKNATSNSYNGFGETDAVGTESQTLMADEMTDGWTHYEGAFTASNEYLVLYQGWASVGVAEVEIYPVEEQTDASVTVTVKYSTDGTEDGVIDDLTYSTSVVKGNSIDTKTVTQYAYNGVYYTAESETVEVAEGATEDITKIVKLVADTSIYAPTAALSWNFSDGTTAYATEFNGTGYAFSESAMDGIMTVSWGKTRHAVVKFNVETEENEILTGATLHVTLGRSNSWSTGLFTVYAVNPSYIEEDAIVDTTVSGMAESDAASAIAALDGYQVVSSTSTAGSNPTTFDLAIDLSDYLTKFPNAGSEVAFMLVSTSGQMGFYRTGEYAPYLDGVTTTTAVSYTVKYVTNGGVSLDDDGTYSTTADNTYGYAGEVVCSNVPIPYFTGYIFTSKSVDTGSSTITLTYTPTSTVDAASVGYDVGNDITNFFYNVDDDTQFVSLNMLGSHDAFTSEINGKTDAALVARGTDSWASLASNSTYQKATKTQDLGILEQLEAGARYFDIRLTRSDSETLPSSSYTTNGVFYTTHSSVSSEFRPILVTLYQWMEEHPGEVVSLYFQEIWDATADGYTDDSGDMYAATSATYADLNALLAETGINDHVPYDYKTSLKNVTYGNLTNSGTTAGAVMFGRIGDSTTSKGLLYTQGNFYAGGTSDTYSWSGKLYTYYDEDNVTKGDTLDADYLQLQVDTVADYNVSDDPSGDHAVYHYARVMQAQTEMETNIFGIPTGSSLLTLASSTNSQLYDLLISEDCSEWLTALPVVMVNAVGTNTSDIVKLLQTCNEAHDITITYVDGDSNTLATKTKSVLVGSLYTDETEYAIVSNSYDSSNSVVYSLETLTTKPSTSYGSAVVYTPSYGLTASSDSTSKIEATITINAAELTDTVYTVQNGVLYSSASGVGSASSNPAFSAYNWGSEVTSPDRVGFAIIKVPDDAVSATQYYALTATRLRMYADSNCNLNTYFYIVPIDDYNTLDVSDNSAIAALYAKATCIAADSKNVDNDDKTSTPVSYVLDADTISSYAGQTVVIIGTSTVGLYGLDDDIAIEVTDKALGVTVLDGAQIRVGNGVDTDNKITTDSGIRFIATVKAENTLVAEADCTEYGIAIYDGGTGETPDYPDENTSDGDLKKIKAVNYQDGDTHKLFTVAITDIASSNYNHIYVAVPYVYFNGAYIYDFDNAVARTPYEVAAGVLTSNSTNSTIGDTTYTYAVDDTTALYKALNAYANMTGARIEFTDKTDYSKGVVLTTYANNATAHFKITSAGYDSDASNYVIVLTADGDNTTFYTYAEETYRVNNSHTSFETATGADAVVSEDGTTLTITIPAATTGTETE